jgi:hypothetical protein
MSWIDRLWNRKLPLAGVPATEAASPAGDDTPAPGTTDPAPAAAPVAPAASAVEDVPPMQDESTGAAIAPQASVPPTDTVADGAAGAADAPVARPASSAAAHHGAAAVDAPNAVADGSDAMANASASASGDAAPGVAETTGNAGTTGAAGGTGTAGTAGATTGGARPPASAPVDTSALNQKIVQAVDFSNAQTVQYLMPAMIQTPPDVMATQSAGLAVQDAASYMNAIMQIALAAQAVIAKKAAEGPVQAAAEIPVLLEMQKMVASAVEVYGNVSQVAGTSAKTIGNAVSSITSG